MPRPANSHHNAVELAAIRRAIPPGTSCSVKQTLLAILLIRATRRPRTTAATLIATTFAAARYHHPITLLIHHILGLAARHATPAARNQKATARLTTQAPPAATQPITSSHSPPGNTKRPARSRRPCSRHASCSEIRHRSIPGPTLYHMSATTPRFTQVILDVLDVLANSPPNNPTWGLRLCQATGHGTGTIYPALDRLLTAGWITDHWEDPPPTDRPRRRLYEITTTGREHYATALRARHQRRATWLTPAPQPGTTP